ncbi:MAG: hypothetical protein ACSLE8_08015 [Rhodococcus sp. (in: high G+C Gram-positive bacteria)]
MTDVVLDASAAIELVAKTTTATRLTALLPTQPVFWVPDGAFDVEVDNVLRRWSLRTDIDQRIIADACYVALAELLGCLTTDIKLVNSPILPIPTIHPSP